jgi:hypothetical protein
LRPQERTVPRASAAPGQRANLHRSGRMEEVRRRILIPSGSRIADLHPTLHFAPRLERRSPPPLAWSTDASTPSATRVASTSGDRPHDARFGVPRSTWPSRLSARSRGDRGRPGSIPGHWPHHTIRVQSFSLGTVRRRHGCLVECAGIPERRFQEGDIRPAPVGRGFGKGDVAAPSLNPAL